MKTYVQMFRHLKEVLNKVFVSEMRITLNTVMGEPLVLYSMNK
jgi:hypothetical protein